MKLVNKTGWNTAHLRAFISRAAKDELPGAGRKRLHVTVQYRRSRPVATGYARGYAYYGTPEHPGGVTLLLPRPEDTPLGLNKIHFATLLAHELAHSRGATHRQINGSAIYDTRIYDTRFYSWAESLPLEPAPPQAPRRAIPKTVVIDQKLEACRVKVAEYRTKIKRSQTFLRKWQRKLRYYERTLAVAAAPTQRQEPENEVPKLQ